MKKILALLMLLLLPLSASAYDVGEVLQVRGACNSPENVRAIQEAIVKDDNKAYEALINEAKCFRLPGGMAIAIAPVGEIFEMDGALWQVWKGENPVVGEVYFLERLPITKI